MVTMYIEPCDPQHCEVGNLEIGQFVSLIARFVVATTLLLAGLAKLQRRGQFERAVRGFNTVPDESVPLVALWLPRVEIACGLLLGLGLAVPIAAFLAGVAFLIFTWIVAANLLRGRRMDCGCFGEFGKPITWWTVGRNSLLLSLAIIAIVVRPSVFSVIPVFGQQAVDPSPGEGVAALIAGSLLVIGVVLMSRVQRLRDLGSGLGAGR